MKTTRLIAGAAGAALSAAASIFGGGRASGYRARGLGQINQRRRLEAKAEANAAFYANAEVAPTSRQVRFREAYALANGKHAGPRSNRGRVGQVKRDLPKVSTAAVRQHLRDMRDATVTEAPVEATPAREPRARKKGA